MKVGNPVLIRRRASSRHKSDKRDAELILDLLLKDEFPAIWRRSLENRQVLEILKLRSSFIKQRTQSYNRLQALAKSFGLPRGQITAKYYQTWLMDLELGVSDSLQRRQLFSLIEKLNEQIEELDNWLNEVAASDNRVELLLTQKGVGLLTALAVVNTIGDVARFTRPTKQIPAYLGLEPLENESAGKRKASNISRMGHPLTRYLLGQSAHIVARYDSNLKHFINAWQKRNRKQ